MKPDILVSSIGRSPVVVEAEYLPATTVEEEAKSRLGLKVADNERKIEAAIALRYPDGLAEVTDLDTALTSSYFSYSVFTLERNDVKRFPESGWLGGSVEDLADLVRLVSVPKSVVDQATDLMQEGIDRVANILDEMENSHPFINVEIAKRLGMINVPQTRRMACAIIANAMVFHEQIVGMYPGIKSLTTLCGSDVDNPKRKVLAAWAHILNEINYWPIFSISKDILAVIPPGYAKRILGTLRFTTSDVNATGVENAHDLTGRIFQNLISDRKYLATFYTLPASAALLARLAIAKMDGIDWADARAIGKLRIADFACGTGALLSAVYEQIAGRHERTGGNPSALHNIMMEDVFYGCDVMPSAVHITCSTLSGMKPAERFRKSHIYALRYGRQEDGSVNIGSLEFLNSSVQWTLFNSSDPAVHIADDSEESPYPAIAKIPDEEFDLVIMNPPFVRATNHEGAHADITNPAFAAFGATKADQKKMGQRINEFGKGSCYHGNAGIASAFAALAHRKLKPGGVLALVLPLTLASGPSWQGFREMLSREYSAPTVLSLAANGKAMSFSSDTGMADCLVICTKLASVDRFDNRALFLSLISRPQDLAQASSLASAMSNRDKIRTIEDGPYGGTPLLIGEKPTGETISAPVDEKGERWGSVRIADYSLAQTAFSLSNSKLWLPSSPSALKVPTAPLAAIGKLGVLDRDIVGPRPRGPFDKMEPSPTATYPALWNHKAAQEVRMVCTPDSQLKVRIGMEDKAGKIWATASRVHLNRDFTFGSQPLAVAFTDMESIGGRVWPNVTFADTRFDYAFSVWSNSTLGLFLFWWHSNRQQSSKANVSIRSAESLPTLDLRTLTDAQLVTAQETFEEFRHLELLPAYLADVDRNRAHLDKSVICDLLDFDHDTYLGVRRLAAKWCAEPSVNGGKRRPSWAKFIA